MMAEFDVRFLVADGQPQHALISNGSMVKRSSGSKFPVARIKKIMQADEDVGKVAQATPVVISKALELFLADIVHATAAQTRKRGAKKITAYHLKRAVHETQTLDFLKDIVEKIADPTGGDSAAAAAAAVPSIAAGSSGPKDDEVVVGPRSALGARSRAAAPKRGDEEDEDEDDEESEEDDDDEDDDDDDDDEEYGSKKSSRAKGRGSARSKTAATASNKRVKRES
ncbi:unnamed protein product [Parajaminaea phylloscopi]